MRFQLKKTITRATVLTALVPTLSLLAADALAHERQPPNPKRDPATSASRGDYVYDALSRNVRTGVTAECVATGVWTPAGATIECHPDMFAKPSSARTEPPPSPPAPVEAAPAAAQYEPYPYAERPAEEAAAAEPDFYAPGDASDLVPVPPAVAEEAADDKISEPRMFYDEEAGVAQDDGITSRSQFYAEEPGVAPEEGVLASSQYYDEEEVGTGDDGILAYRREYEEEEGAAKDEGILATSQYYEEEGVQPEEGILASSQYYDEEGVQPEEGILASSQYYDEEGKEAADTISEPKAFPEEQVAAAEEKQPETKAEPEPEAKAEAEAKPEAKAEAKPEPRPEPKPEPKPVVLPVTITVEADALFDFDKYNIRSDARAKLDKLVSDLPGVKYDQILVVGHADRIGTKKYNQRLSERRASSAKSYLVSKGLPAEKIKTDSRGELEPVTTREQCKGQRKTRLIACLQPDRRVEITVTGQK